MINTSLVPDEIVDIQNEYLIRAMPTENKPVDWDGIISQLESVPEVQADDLWRAYNALKIIRSYNFERRDYLDAYLLDVARYGLGEINFDPNPVEYGLSAKGE